ncbi:DNA oxidative demethylase AlkB [Aliikangiella sp. IMCC44359]|uniref:DNA oxidative demethylase AlkB n=1 Tax=Aliikangiella sp. IMCC44359 TaxID=3459125 RepID=UPI00403ABB7A
MSDLFTLARPEQEEIYPETFLLSNFVNSQQLLSYIPSITQQAPFRKMLTPNGHYTNIAMTSCGDYGWVSDLKGYRYSATDPETQKPWPKIPEYLNQIALQASKKIGYTDFIPDTCLINHYVIGSKLGSHQDKNEKNFRWPIISISLGLNAIFQIFGQQRSGPSTNVPLYDGDVMVWGGKSRLIYHGVKTLKADPYNPNLNYRINLTFRKCM